MPLEIINFYCASRVVKKRNWLRSNNTPYAIEQGIVFIEQGILAHEQGISPANIEIIAGLRFRYAQVLDERTACLRSRSRRNILTRGALRKRKSAARSGHRDQDIGPFCEGVP